MSHPSFKAAGWRMAFAAALWLGGVSGVQADVAAGVAALDARDFPTAIKVLNEAVEAGEADASFYLGRMLELGLGVPVDPRSAVQMYEQGATAGSVLAQNRLGLFFLAGEIVLQDYERARSLFCGAAATGDANGLFNCAMLKLEGRGADPDPAAAIADLELAAAQDHIGAMNVLAQIYLAGEVAQQDVAAGIALVQKTASFGNPAGLFAVGKAYAEGQGLEADPVRAHAYYNLAAAAQHPQAAQARAAIEAQLTPAQVIEAQKIARDWRAVEAPAVP